MKYVAKHTQEFKHENKERLCFYCNELQGSKKDICNFVIKGRKGRSLFADEHFTIQLCSHCVEELEVSKEWFDNELCYNTNNQIYNYETYILGMVNTFPIENQEYVFNCYNSNFCKNVNEKRMSREDWIKDNS